MDKTRMILITALLLGLTAIMLPASGVQAQTAITHPFDNAVLLMISSQMRLDGEVQSAMLPGGHVLAPARQADVGTEIDVLINLYASQIAKLQASDDYNPDLEAKLASQLDDKVKDLQEKAQALEARRRRRRGGLFGFINRGLKGLGRGTGWLMGKTMEGTGIVAEFAIEKVAPKVLKEAVLNGAPLNGALVRRVVRELLKKRVNTLLEREVGKLAVRIGRGQEAAYNDGQPTVSAGDVDDLLEAFGGDNDGQAPQPDPGGSSGESAGQDIVVYDFNASDAWNFTTSDWGVGRFSWSGYWAGVQGDGYCFMETMVADSAVVHLEFNQQDMTVSGYIEASTQSSKTSDTNGVELYNASGSYRVEFSDLKTFQYTSTDPENNGIVLSYQGEGSGKGSISGTVNCRYYSEASKGDVYVLTNGQSSNDLPVPITLHFYRPDYVPQNGHKITMNIFGATLEEEGFSYSFDLAFDQPFEALLP